MTQAEFKDKIFEQRQKDKDSIGGIYSRQKIMGNFIELIQKMSYKEYMQLDYNGQMGVIRNIFGDNKEMLKSTVQKKMQLSIKLGEERKKSKQK